MTESTGPRGAVIYARISQDREGAGLGVERQEQDCRALAASLGWEVVAVHSDNDVSAYSGRKRPGYLALLDDLESGRATGVLAWHTDRLHRSPTELETYIDICEKHGVLTHTVKAGDLDLATPSGRAIARTLGAWARFESEHKGERVRRARLQKAQAGGWSGGVRPFGFEPDGVTIRESEAAEIVKATDAILVGAGLGSIARDLNSRGIRTTFGKNEWTIVALKDVLLRPRNAGLSIYKGEVIGQASWMPIVPEETWRAAVAILTDPNRITNGGNNQIKWLGSGLYVCGPCGAVMRVGTSGNPPCSKYRCRRGEHESGHVTRRVVPLDDFVERVIVTRLQRPDAIDLLTPSESVEVDTAGLSAEATGLRQRLTELSEAFAEGALTISQLRAGTEKMQARLAEINELVSAAVKLDPLADLAGRADADVVWFGKLPDRSDGLSLDRRRAVLDAIVTVTVLRGGRGPGFDASKIQIDWKR